MNLDTKQLPEKGKYACFFNIQSKYPPTHINKQIREKQRFPQVFKSSRRGFSSLKTNLK